MIPDQLKTLAVVTALEEALPGVVTGGHADLGEVTLFIEPSRIVETCRHLKKRGFNRLSGITAVDWHPADPRFEVVYFLHALPVDAPAKGERVRLKCRVAEVAAEIDSVIGVWRSADWYEREVFDMFGIRFRNHPNLQRILMPTDWEGHPLRKDYPVHGHKYSYQNE